MKIKVMTLHVTDQDKALRFYTEKLGFVKKADVSHGGYRWLTVVSPEEPNGVQLVLSPAAFVPAAQTYQQALHQQGMPAAMFYVDDVGQEHDRLRGAGVTFTRAPAKTVGSTIAMLDDTCGNLIQLTQLDARSN